MVVQAVVDHELGPRHDSDQVVNPTVRKNGKSGAKGAAGRREKLLALVHRQRLNSKAKLKKQGDVRMRKAKVEISKSKRRAKVLFV